MDNPSDLADLCKKRCRFSLHGGGLSITRPRPTIQAIPAPSSLGGVQVFPVPSIYGAGGETFALTTDEAVALLDLLKAHEDEMRERAAHEAQVRHERIDRAIASLYAMKEGSNG